LQTRFYMGGSLRKERIKIHGFILSHAGLRIELS
jgi:hypothetical protein